jgi:hypothetical protein
MLVDICSGETVFEPADGRLAGQCRILIRQPLTGYFHYRIAPQFIAVISILIATGNLENPLLEKLKNLMFDIAGMAPIPQRIGHFADHTYPVFNLAEEKKSGVRTDLTSIEIGFNLLAGNAPVKSFKNLTIVFIILSFKI